MASAEASEHGEQSVPSASITAAALRPRTGISRAGLDLCPLRRKEWRGVRGLVELTAFAAGRGVGGTQRQDTPRSQKAVLGLTATERGSLLLEAFVRGRPALPGPALARKCWNIRFKQCGSTGNPSR